VDAEKKRKKRGGIQPILRRLRKGKELYEVDGESRRGFEGGK